MQATTSVCRQEVAAEEVMLQRQMVLREPTDCETCFSYPKRPSWRFLLFADDDNMYVPGFAEQVKDVVSSDIHSPLLIRGYFEYSKYNQETLWKTPEVLYANIDTMCAVLPITLLSRVEGEHQAGDYALFSHLIDEADRHYMIDVVIFHYTKQNGGAR